MSAEQIKEALRNEDVEVRRQAVIAIGESKDEIDDLGACLFEALGDEQWRVRKEAVEVARRHAVRLQILPRLVDAICQGQNVGLRNAALDVLQELGPQAAEVLLRALPRVPDNARRFVVEALVCGGDERVVPVLIEATRESDSMVVAAAMDALASIGGSDAEAALRKQLRSQDSFLRMAALDALTRLDAVVPWEELSPLLNDRLVRRVALESLGRCGRPEAVTPLVQALAEKSTHAVTAAAIALSRLLDGPDEVVREVQAQVRGLSEQVRVRLRALLREGALDVRQAVSRILFLARDEPSLPSAIELASLDALPRDTIESLRPWGETPIRAMLSMVTAPGDTPPAVALELACDVASDLQTIDPNLYEEIRSVLRRAIISRDPAVVLAAARCMGQWGDEQDASSLVKAAENGTEEIAQACGRSLLALAERAHDAVQQAVRHARLEGAAGAPLAAVVASVGGDDAFARLQTALGAQDATTRQEAVAGIAKLGGSRVAELIAFSLADENVDVQMTAARALGALRDEQGRAVGTESLLLALQGDSPAVQAAAARALGETGDNRAVEPLRERVRAGEPGVAVAAIEALRNLGDSDLGELLVEAMGHDDEEVVKQALIAISEAGDSRAVERISIGLEHVAWDVRRLAADLLGSLKESAAVSALKARLQIETDELVLDAIRKALAELGEAP